MKKKKGCFGEGHNKNKIAKRGFRTNIIAVTTSKIKELPTKKPDKEKQTETAR